MIFIETSTGEILMTRYLVSTKKKPVRVEIYQKKRHGNVSFVILRFAAEQLDITLFLTIYSWRSFRAKFYFDHIVELALEGLKLSNQIQAYWGLSQSSLTELFCENS